MVCTMAFGFASAAGAGVAARWGLVAFNRLVAILLLAVAIQHVKLSGHTVIVSCA